MQKMMVLLGIAVLMVGLAGIANAQIPPVISDPVPGDGATGLPTTTGNNVPYGFGLGQAGDPVNGIYDILINGWIYAYARVDVYDNHINFAQMSPTHGTYASPQARYAWLAGDGGLLPDEIGSMQAVMDHNGGNSARMDTAGFRIQTNARLDLNMDMGSFLRRVTEQGDVWTGQDTRKSALGNPIDDYELANQVKVAFRGRFLTYTDPLIPADVEAGTQYISPTSNQATNYANGLPQPGTGLPGWTDWAIGVNQIDDAAGAGWFWPDTSGACPWTGGPVYVPNPGLPRIQDLTLIVERGQAQDSGTAEAAEVWFAQRILRRGLQDVQGNYRALMQMELTYRESDVWWNPALP